MRRLSARPRQVGRHTTKDDAEWILARLRERGFEAFIETCFPTPKKDSSNRSNPTKFQAKLPEPVLPVDLTASPMTEQLPTCNACSIDGDVTAPLVYVNYGNREDYEKVNRLAISVKGAIVIACYGSG